MCVPFPLSGKTETESLKCVGVHVNVCVLLIVRLKTLTFDDFSSFCFGGARGFLNNSSAPVTYMNKETIWNKNRH